MATIKFLLQSKSSSSNIYVRYSISRTINLKRKTGFVIDSKNWSYSKKSEALPIIERNENLKNLKSKLRKLKLFLEDAYNDASGSGVEFTPAWLQDQIDIFNNRKPLLELDVLTTYIDKFLAEAPYKQNKKGEVGLSAGRIANLKLFRNTILRYQQEKLEGKKILLKNIDLQFVEGYKMWLFGKGYSINYVGKNIANLKTICYDAFMHNIETSPQLKGVKGMSETRSPEEIIYLSEDEQLQIKNAPIIREALVNARKWLLLGCLIGQRGGDLLNITEKNIKELVGIKIIELKQQKTGKLVAIPLHPDALKIIESGFPYKISLVKFNEYIKDVCEAANINQLMTGRKREEKKNTTLKAVHPKYKLISSHTCRRSFATNFYGRIPTSNLMGITAHGSEKMFLAYIGKTSYDNAYQVLDYFSKLAPRETQPVMEVIRNTAN